MSQLQTEKTWSIKPAITSASPPLFETAAAKYDWINRVVAVGIGHRRAEGPIYSIFEVL